MKIEPKVIEDFMPNIIYLARQEYIGTYVTKFLVNGYPKTIRVDDIRILQELISLSNKNNYFTLV